VHLKRKYEVKEEITEVYLKALSPFPLPSPPFPLSSPLFLLAKWR
jgi:hypothetical protein